jgi:alanine racemase
VDRQIASAEVSFSNLTHNLNVVRNKAGDKHILTVVKANAYGHGSIPIAKHLISNGVSMLGVAFAHEGITLRESGIDVPILVFFDRYNYNVCIEYRLTPVIFDTESAKNISTLARRQNIKMPIHIKVDTGMGRVGMRVERSVSEITKISRLGNVYLEGLMSHFSDADLEDKDFAISQLAKFQSLVKELKQSNIVFKYLHMANSAAVLTMPDAHYNLVRPGIMLYGYGCCEKDKLKPVMKISSRIVLIKKVPAGTSISYGRTFITRRKSTIATVPVGYADGFSRQLSNSGEVLINGKRAPVIGRVCMDTFMVDITDIPGVSYTSEVVLIGRQGKEGITADDIAEKTGTIPYEVLTSVGERIRRVYK